LVTQTQTMMNSDHTLEHRKKENVIEKYSML